MYDRIKIFYGIINNKIDVTDVCLKSLMRKSIVCIPSKDTNRDDFFPDPIFGIVKQVYIEYINESNQKITTSVDQTKCVYIDLRSENIGLYDIYTVPDDIYTQYHYVENNLKQLHQQLKLDYGTFDEEYPEQIMAQLFIKPESVVLEIGTNIARNTMIIASILSDQTNLVTLESDQETAIQAIHNRDKNNMKFHIEPSALSVRPLIQNRWDTIVSSVVLPGYKKVQTITLEELRKKYPINFDTLVLDCEGAFYYILLDMPDILTNINTIIVENDYQVREHYEYVKNKLTEARFESVYTRRGGLSKHVCRENFFEVLQRKIE